MSSYVSQIPTFLHPRYIRRCFRSKSNFTIKLPLNSWARCVTWKLNSIAGLRALPIYVARHRFVHVECRQEVEAVRVHRWVALVAHISCNKWRNLACRSIWRVPTNLERIPLDRGRRGWQSGASLRHFALEFSGSFPFKVHDQQKCCSKLAEHRSICLKTSPAASPIVYTKFRRANYCSVIFSLFFNFFFCRITEWHERLDEGATGSALKNFETFRSSVLEARGENKNKLTTVTRGFLLFAIESHPAFV